MVPSKEISRKQHPAVTGALMQRLINARLWRQADDPSPNAAYHPRPTNAVAEEVGMTKGTVANIVQRMAYAASAEGQADTALTARYREIAAWFNPLWRLRHVPDGVPLLPCRTGVGPSAEAPRTRKDAGAKAVRKPSRVRVYDQLMDPALVGAILKARCSGLSCAAIAKAAGIPPGSLGNYTISASKVAALTTAQAREQGIPPCYVKVCKAFASVWKASRRFSHGGRPDTIKGYRTKAQTDAVLAAIKPYADRVA